VNREFIRGFVVKFYAIVFCVSMFSSLLGMKSEVSFLVENKPKFPKFPIEDYVLLYQLPMDVQRHIGDYIMQLNGINFDTVDCYEKCIFYEKNPKEDAYRYSGGYEVPSKIRGKEGDWYSYPNTKLQICAPQYSPGSLSVWNLSSGKQIFKNQYWDSFVRLIDLPFSLHANLFLVSQGKNPIISLYAVGNGKKLHDFQVGYAHGSAVEAQFAIGQPIIKLMIHNCRDRIDTHKFYFKNPVRTLLQSMLQSKQFIWKEVLILSALYKNSKKYESTKIEKGTIDYCIYENLIAKMHGKSPNIPERDIYAFFRTYLNVEM